MYADDFALLMSFNLSEFTSAVLIVNWNLQSIANWVASNVLHLNPTKSTLIIVDFLSLTFCLQSFDICLTQFLFLVLLPLKYSECTFLLGFSFLIFRLNVKPPSSNTPLFLSLHSHNSSETPHNTSRYIPIRLCGVIYTPALTKQIFNRIQCVQNAYLRFYCVC